MVCENIFTAPPRPNGHKIDYVTIFSEILNPEGHPNCITGSKVTAYLLNVWILPIGGASARKGLRLQPVQQACYLKFLTFSFGFVGSAVAFFERVFCQTHISVTLFN